MNRLATRVISGLAGIVPATTIAASTALFLALLAYAMFVLYPGISQPGDAQHSTGAGGLRWIDLAVASLITCAYTVAALVARSKDEPETRRSMAVGVAVGAAAALVTGVALVRSAMLAATPDDLRGAAALQTLLFLVAPPLACALGAQAYRSVTTGVLAGFWCSMAFCILVATVTLARGLIFADHLAQTAWAGDLGPNVIGYELGDELGRTAFLLMLGPMVGALLGGTGGVLMTALFAPRAQIERGFNWRSRAKLVPVWFLSGMFVLTFVRMATGLF